MTNETDCLINNLLSEHNHAEKKSTRDGFGEGLLALGEKNPNVVALSADLTESTRVHKFKEKFPKRFFSLGVAEQNLAGIGAGLALSGKIPFITSFGVFSPGRNWDQIRVSVCYSQANVKIVGSHAGFSNGPDGATHQALEDIALTRVLPNLTVVSPIDYEQTKSAVEAIANHKGPVYLRITRNKTPQILSNKSKFKLGEAQLLKEGKHVSIITTGTVGYEALLASEMLAEKYQIECEVINIHTIKPLDKEAIINSAKKTKKVLTVEEHQKNGGLGSAVAEVLGQNHPTMLKIMGVEDTFGESGQPHQLLEKYGLSANHIMQETKELYHK